MAREIRKIIDCRDFPSDIGCTLFISGSAKAVFNVSLRHAVEDHGHKDTPELRRQIKKMMKNDKTKNKNSDKGNKK